MKIILISLLSCCFTSLYSQETSKEETKIKFDNEKFLKEISNNACNCIDSIHTGTKTKDTIAAEISRCIGKQVVAYQMGMKISTINISDKGATTDTTKNVTLSINTNPNSKEYKQYYYEIENYLMANCESIKDKIAVDDVVRELSQTKNSEAKKYYNLGQDEKDKENYSKAIEYYKKAVVLDPNFAFAYDNIGICYRKLSDYDKAIDAYEKSLEIDPNGTMPLQNIAVAYSYKKEYKKAVKAYERLAKLDDKNPEVYFGIGQIYAQSLFDYEKALDNLCQAYNLYVEQKSPYRTDAETLINIVYAELKKQGKEATFNEILKKHHISQN